MMQPEMQLEALGLALPEAPAPVGSYVPCRTAGDLLFVSGQLPLRNGELVAKGKVGAAVTVEQAAEAARYAVLNALVHVSKEAKGLCNVIQVVRVGVYVNSAPGFTAQAQVANGASDLLVALFEEAGRHSRLAVGVSELPMDAPVEVEMVLQIQV